MNAASRLFGSRNTAFRALILLAAACGAGPSSSARAQCEPRWAPGFGQVVVGNEIEAICVHQNSLVFGGYVSGGVGTPLYRLRDGALRTIGNVSNNPFANEPEIHAVLSIDFGSGPEVVVAGLFDHVDNVPANNVARWDGSAWHALGVGLGDGWSPPVVALAAFDDGTGVRLYAGGNFDIPGGGHGIARWNGTSFESVGGITLDNVGALCVHDDGTGRALYAGGRFAQVGAQPASSVARWNGSAWSIVGAVNNTVPTITGFAVHAGDLYVSGSFTSIGGVSAAHVARWDGTTWSALASGLNGYSRAVVSFDDGSGPALYAFGSFSQAGGVPAAHVARWNGASWSALGSGLSGYGYAAVAWNDGTGAGLFAGGDFLTAGGVNSRYFARWRSSGWERVTVGLGFDYPVRTLLVHDDGSGPKLFAGGYQRLAGGAVSGLVTRFDGTSWSTLGGGLGNAADPYYLTYVDALAAFDDGNGVQLYAGGAFTTAGGLPAANLARWNGSTWSALPGGSINGVVRSLCVHDDGSGPALYVGGTFTQAGGITSPGIARWNGSAWSAVGNGASQSSSSLFVDSLVSFDDGHGLGLFAGGSFVNMSAVQGTQNLACWRNGAWSSLGGPYFGGSDRDVNYLGVHDDGQGPRLWLGGLFTELGGYYAKGVGTWDGTRFWPVGSGFPLGANEAYTVNALCTWDDGVHGAQVYAGGTMQSATDPALQGFARWDGTAWIPIAGGLTNPQYGTPYPHAGALAAQGGSLWAGGGFTQAGDTPSYSIGRFDRTCTAPIVFCSGDGTGTACPCGNTGSSGHGCATSFNAAGASLSSSGTASVSADTVTLMSSGTSSAIVTFVQGTQRQAGGAGSLFGDGLRCTGGTVVRLGGINAPGGTAQYPPPGGQPISVRGQLPAAGGTRTYQVWYRNAVPFCTPSTFNLTNGIELLWVP